MIFKSGRFLGSLLVLGTVLAVGSVVFRQESYGSVTVNAEKKNELVEIKNIVYNIGILRTVCKAVKKVDDNIRGKLYQMRDIMYLSEGIGIAANQVGFLHQLVVIDLQTGGTKEPKYLINPKIVWKSEKTKSFEEGCLSIPATSKSKIVRPAEVEVAYLDENGEERTTGKVGGVFAVCLQHEIGHLNGELYIDLLPENERNRIVNEALSILEKMKR
jgi:peptide deformylase